MEQQSLNFFGEPEIPSVSEVIGKVKGLLEGNFRDILVQGELSNFARPASGHLYFTLKDETAQIAAVCFRMQARYLKFEPEDGMKVTARGNITLYPPRGQLQMVVETMEPIGKGALQVAFEQLKTRLQEEGLFDAAHKKPLPMLPSKIGVVTSSTGAALHDILRVLKRRNGRLDVLIYPTRVQGTSAAREIAAGIRHLNTRSDIDVLIVGRGGGSLEDLWSFNEEVVARAIYESRIPVISAVGHEVDFTISDFVADLRAPTPSAAAEIVSARREELVTQVTSLTRRGHQSILLLLQRKRHKYQILTQSRGFIDAQSRVRMLIQRLDELQLRLLGTLPYTLERHGQSLKELTKDLRTYIGYFVKDQSQRVKHARVQLEAFSPQRVLERGYAIVTAENGKIVRDPDDVNVDQILGIRVARGRFRARKENDDGV